MKSSKSSSQNSNKLQFISKDDFENNLESQNFKITRTLGVMGDFNLKAKEKIEIDFFFYTDTSEKAQELSNRLKKLNFEASWHKPIKDHTLYSVVCWTDKMENDEELLTYWAKFMCQLGYKFDCEFDGWGMVSYPE
ncbi:MAG TPA: ribonuclease E inhibitor RraB [Flavobacteriaceae bacterium]|nr:ribonuclease E inhibitor RraB [Flavobacteriaceae bacterium]